MPKFKSNNPRRLRLSHPQATRLANENQNLARQSIKQAKENFELRERVVRLEAENKDLLAVADNSALILAWADIACLKESVSALKAKAERLRAEARVDPGLEQFTGDLLAKYWPLLTVDNQEAFRTAVQDFMLSRLCLPTFFQIHQVEAAYPHLYEFLENTTQKEATGFKMIDSLHCECGGQYDHLDQQQDDGGVVDTYQCDGCSTFCLVTWNPETQQELGRVYTTAEGEPL